MTTTAPKRRPASGQGEPSSRSACDDLEPGTRAGPRARRRRGRARSPDGRARGTAARGGRRPRRGRAPPRPPAPAARSAGSRARARPRRRWQAQRPPPTSTTLPVTKLAASDEQPDDRLGDLVRRADPAERRRLDDRRVARVAAERLVDLGVDQAGRHRVDADAVRRRPRARGRASAHRSRPWTRRSARRCWRCPCAPRSRTD